MVVPFRFPEAIGTQVSSDVDQFFQWKNDTKHDSKRHRSKLEHVSNVHKPDDIPLNPDCFMGILIMVYYNPYFFFVV